MISARLKRLSLIILGPLVALGAAELSLRVLNAGYPTAFLVPREIAGRRVYVDNQFFGYRFFPQRMTRTPAAIVIEKKKAPDVVRVFILGESAAMGEPQSEFGLSRFLEILLAGRSPGKRFEVVNAAMTAINSHAIAEIARDLAAFHPDVFVVYMGNNEVVGPFGPGTVFGNSRRLTRFRVLVGRLRLSQFLRFDKRGQRWSGMEMFRERHVAADDERLDAVYDGFQANLNRIIAAARNAGASVVLSTVAVNLRDCAPFAGDQARAAFDAGKLAEARDLDELRFRADSSINQITRNVGEWAGSGVKLVDAEKLFSAQGREVFIDHVHFTTNGNYWLASVIADAIAPPAQPPPSLTDCLDRMNYTRWNELDLVDEMIQRRRRAPFVGQPGNAAQLQELLGRKSDLVELLRGEDVAGLRHRYEEAMQASPSDWRLLHAWSEILMNMDDYESAEAILRRELELVPHRFDVHGALALLLGYRGRADAGVDVLRSIPGRHGHFVPEFLLNNARALARGGKPQEAWTFAAAASALAPDNMDARLEYAARCAAVGRIDEAERTFRDVLARDPSNATARDELAGFLALHEQWDEAARVILAGGTNAATRLKYAQLLAAHADLAGAERELREIANQDGAASAEAPFALARILVRQGRTDEAQAALETALKMDPDNEAYRKLSDSLPTPDHQHP